MWADLCQPVFLQPIPAELLLWAGSSVGDPLPLGSQLGAALGTGAKYLHPRSKVVPLGEGGLSQRGFQGRHGPRHVGQKQGTE